MTIIDYVLGNAGLMGSFEHSLCKAWTLASESNKRRLETAFPQHFPTDMMYFGTHDFRDYPSKEEWRKAYDSYAKQPINQYAEIKSKYPERLIIFRHGDFYEAYENDAKVCADTLGLVITWRNNKTDFKNYKGALTGFPYRALDSYLPKLIRAGHKVCICDLLEEPKQTRKTITELV